MVMHQVDQVRNKKTDRVPKAEQMGTIADASTWNF